MPSGLDLEGAVAAGGLAELADGPAGLVLDPAADRQCGEDDGQVGLDRVAQVVWGSRIRPPVLAWSSMRLARTR